MAGARSITPLTRWSQVTHYYFEDCIYYTPALSDEIVGRLHRRDLVSISDGLPRPNSYLGEPVITPPRLPLHRRVMRADRIEQIQWRLYAAC